MAKSSKHKFTVEAWPSTYTVRKPRTALRIYAAEHHASLCAPPRSLLLLPRSWQMKVDARARSVCRAAARVELMVTWLPKWSVLWRRCLLPAAAKPVRLNGRLTGHRKELLRSRKKWGTAAAESDARNAERQRTADVALIVLRCFAPGQSGVRDRKE